MIGENYICDCDFIVSIKDRHCCVCGRFNYRFKLPPTEEELKDKIQRNRERGRAFYAQNIEKLRKKARDYYQRHYAHPRVSLKDKVKLKIGSRYTPKEKKERSRIYFHNRYYAMRTRILEQKKISTLNKSVKRVQ